MKTTKSVRQESHVERGSVVAQKLKLWQIYYRTDAEELQTVVDLLDDAGAWSPQGIKTDDLLNPDDPLFDMALRKKVFLELRKLECDLSDAVRRISSVQTRLREDALKLVEKII